MEPARFDDFTRALGLAASRRGLLKAGLALAAGSLARLAGIPRFAPAVPPAAAQAFPAGAIDCDGMLVQSQRDSEYCGDCDTRCPGTHHCVDGHCVPDVRTAVADDGCNARYLRLWFNGFIAQEIPNITLPSPSAAGATITRPLFASTQYVEGDRCFVTDGRTYSSHPRDKSLFHSAVEIDLTDMSIVNEDHRGDPLELVDCGNGDALCSENIAASALKFSTPWAATPGAGMSLTWSAASPLPCIDGAPALDYEVHVLVERASPAGAVRVQASGTRQAFPAFEIYAALDGSVPATVLQRGPDAGSAMGDVFLEPPRALDLVESTLLCGCGQCEPGRACREENGLQVCDDLRSFHLLSALPDPADVTAAASIVADGFFEVTVHEAPIFTNSSNGIDHNIPVRTVGLVAAEGDRLRLRLRNPGGVAAFGSAVWLHRLIDGRSIRLFDPADPLPAGEAVEIALPIEFGQVRDWSGAVVCCELPDAALQLCADAWNDRVHCGSCGHACTSGQYCAKGVCHCLPPRTTCAGGCVDLMTDPLHCGACDAACADNGRCEAGTCV